MEPQKKQHAKSKVKPTEGGIKQRESVICIWAYLWNSPFYLVQNDFTLLSLEFSGALGALEWNNSTAANLPQSYRHMADWFFNISLCVSLQMLRGTITLLNCLAVKNCGMSSFWTVWRASTSLRSRWEAKAVRPVCAHFKAVIRLIPKDHTAQFPQGKDDLIHEATKRQTSV